jgi:hypothetical protein
LPAGFLPSRAAVGGGWSTQPSGGELFLLDSEDLGPWPGEINARSFPGLVFLPFLFLLGLGVKSYRLFSAVPVLRKGSHVEKAPFGSAA